MVHCGHKSLTLRAECFGLEEPELENFRPQNTQLPHRVYESQGVAKVGAKAGSHRVISAPSGREGDKPEGRVYDYDKEVKPTNPPVESFANHYCAYIRASLNSRVYVSPYRGPWSVQNNPQDGFGNTGGRVDEEGEPKSNTNDGDDDENGGGYREYDGSEERWEENSDGEESSGAEEAVDEHEPEFLSLEKAQALMIKRLDDTAFHRDEEFSGEEDGGAEEIIDERYEYEDDEGAVSYGGAILL